MLRSWPKTHPVSIAMYLLLVLMAAGFTAFLFSLSEFVPDVRNQSPQMTITSPAFVANSKIPQTYTCDGDNVSPPLQVGQLPAHTQSLVVIVDDPDVGLDPRVHWLVWNILPDKATIAGDVVPDGAIQGITDANQRGYSGPCPPRGTHTYRFRVYALNTILDLPASSTASVVVDAMNRHILQSAELVGYYQRTP